MLYLRRDGVELRGIFPWFRRGRRSLPVGPWRPVRSFPVPLPLLLLLFLIELLYRFGQSNFQERSGFNYIQNFRTDSKRIELDTCECLRASFSAVGLSLTDRHTITKHQTKSFDAVGHTCPSYFRTNLMTAVDQFCKIFFLLPLWI